MWYLVTEFCHNGSLDNYIQKNPGLNQQARLKLTLDVAHGMAFLHSKKIIHLDLKPANILVTGEGRCKVADFGLSKMVNSTIGCTTVQAVGGFTFKYAPPEILSANPWSYSADVYSFGITLWETLTGQTPFADVSSLPVHVLMTLIVHQGKRPTIPPTMNASVKGLVEICWITDPEKRPTFETVATVIQENL